MMRFDLSKISDVRLTVFAALMLPFLLLTGCGEPPEACFSVDSTVVDMNDDILFTNCSVFQQAGYQWDFGDGTTSTMTSPTHSFAEQGEYLVVLTSLGNNSVNDDTYSEIIKVAQRRLLDILIDQLPQDNNGANWDATDGPDVKVRFTNQSTGTVEYTTETQMNVDVTGDVSFIEPTAPFELKPNSYTIEILDEDDTADEVMASFSIDLETFIPVENQTIDFTDGDATMVISYQLF